MQTIFEFCLNPLLYPLLSRHLDVHFMDGEELYQLSEEARKSYCGCNKVESNTLQDP